jgi:hypothetical protein
LSKGERPKVSEVGTLKTAFEPLRAQVTGKWRKLRNGELYNQFSSPNIFRVATLRRALIEVFVGKPSAKNPFARPRRKWANTVKNDVKEI